jgi:hypothetical protein
MMRKLEFRAWDNARGEYLSAGKVMIQVLTGKNPKVPDVCILILVILCVQKVEWLWSSSLAC